MSHAYHTSSILARSEFILNPPDYRNVAYEKGYFTDYAIGVRLCLEGKVRFLDRNMSVYRIGRRMHKGQLQSRFCLSGNTNFCTLRDV